MHAKLAAPNPTPWTPRRFCDACFRGSIYFADIRGTLHLLALPTVRRFLKIDESGTGSTDSVLQASMRAAAEREVH